MGKWKSKDAAIYLVTSLAAKAQTQKVQNLSFSLTLHQLLAVSGHFSKDREQTYITKHLKGNEKSYIIAKTEKGSMQGKSTCKTTIL